MSEDKKIDESRDEKGRFTHGNPGKPKGATNNLMKIFLTLFEKIETKAQEEEAVDSFFDWATKNEKNQGMFYQMLSKMLPTNVSVEGEVPITYIISEKFAPRFDEKKKEKNGEE